MYLRKHGDSSTQREIERVILDELKQRFCAEDWMENVTLPLPFKSDVQIKPDFYSEKHKIIGEIHAHLGKLKSAQMHKVAADILKLHLFDPDHAYQKYFVVCDQKEYEQLQGNSYLAAAISQFEIELIYIELDENRRADLQNAMKRQNMFRDSSTSSE